MANHVLNHWLRAYAIADRAPTERLKRMYVRLVSGRLDRNVYVWVTRTLWILFLRHLIDSRARSPFSEN